MKIVLSKDFREFIQSLNENNVRYLIVGGYAVAFHGHPRYTKDMDVWIEHSNENAIALIHALDQFGFGDAGLKVEDFSKPDQIIQLGVPPNRIDILTSIDGVEFSECFKRKVEMQSTDLKINFIDLDNLKKNKKSSGRFQDLADLENLE